MKSGIRSNGGPMPAILVLGATGAIGRGVVRAALDTAGVSDRRQGRWVYYALNPEMFDLLEAIVGEMKPSRRGLRVLRPACE